MIDLSDVTFTVPVRIDSQQRLENFIVVLSYLLEKFYANIIILEDDDEQKISFDRPPERVKYIFQKTKDPLFHKTKIINQLCRISSTSIVAMYDCDVLFDEKQYIKAVQRIREDQCDLCLPSNSHVFEIERAFVGNIMKDYSLTSFPTYNVIGRGAVGGCVFYRKDAFIRGGMANEKIISYGYEDQEIVLRFEKLGFRVDRIDGCLYHLQHPRGTNSLRSHPSYDQNRKEFAMIVEMNRDELENYVRTWRWIAFS